MHAGLPIAGPSFNQIEGSGELEVGPVPESNLYYQVGKERARVPPEMNMLPGSRISDRA
jgi:hypothetical protein